MSSQVTANAADGNSIWDGGRVPLGSSYGKLMMWIFLLTDVFTFSAFLVAYGFFRVSSETWPDPEVVFQSIPGITDTGAPLVFVGIMTFILILSSVTMVLAVEAGHRNSKVEVLKYLVATVALGAVFLICQAFEWAHLIHEGMTLTANPFGDQMFAYLFFIITGFHGFHVFIGVVLLVIALIQTLFNVYHKRGHYEMVEKIGLYWHFVDLVWVFVFTLFYLI